MIYCVEDDQNIQELIVYTLNSSNLEAKGFNSSRELYADLAKQKPDIIVLDIMLPDENGLDILRNLKLNPLFSNIPIIMLTAKSSEYDKVLGLDLGADDYITKPFSMMELVARIKACLRRNIEVKSNIIKIKDLTLDSNRHIVTYKNEKIILTLKEYELLKKLMENIGICISREKLLEDIWGYDYYGETRTVDVHIRTLRSKLLGASDYIETIRGVGYKMID